MEWDHFRPTKGHNRLIDKLYTLLEPIMQKLKVPSVDAPVVAISSAMTLPSEGESVPKDSCDKRVEAALKQNFETCSQGFQMSITSIFSRVA